MNVFLGKLFFLLLFGLTVCAEITSELDSNEQNLPRYVVFPGLDAGGDEVAEWSVGFASPFNVFFGPKPYVLGWVGEAPFAPGDEDDEDIYDEEDIEDEEGEEVDEEAPDYDYDNLSSQ